MGMRSELEDALAAVVKEMAATLSAEPCEGGQTVQEDVMEIEELLEEDEEPEPATEPVQELEVQIPDRLLLSVVAEPDKAVTETVASIRQLHDSLSIPVSKVAKVTGAKLNKMGMQTALGKLDGADMIVIGASELEDGVLEDCVQAVREGSDSMVIALCGSTEEISVLDGRIRGILKTELPELHNAIAKGEAAAVSPAAEPTPEGDQAAGASGDTGALGRGRTGVGKEGGIAGSSGTAGRRNAYGYSGGKTACKGCVFSGSRRCGQSHGRCVCGLCKGICQRIGMYI